MDVIIRQNTIVPCESTRTFTTVGDDQSKVVLEVLQGEAVRADACYKVTKLEV